jgi:hypothetical protein
MSQWYLSYDGNQIGPLDKSQAMAQAQKNPKGHAWREGYAQWLPISQIAELSAPEVPIPEPPSFAGRSADEIDFKIFGSEMQFVEVELDPGESVVAEAGAMMYKDHAVIMETVFGDASGSG